MIMFEETASSMSAEDKDILSRLAQSGFERVGDTAMHEDTLRHIAEADLITTAREDGEIIAFSMFRRCLGDNALEAAGIVVKPEYQGQGVGTMMLGSTVRLGETMTAYTRNPALIKAVAAACGGPGTTYPLTSSPSHLGARAASMENAITLDDGFTYHVGRYGDTGLYGGEDPADKPLFEGGASLKTLFRHLEDTSTALVVAGIALQPYYEGSRR